MARTINRLNQLKISALEVGYHHDGHGLYLQVSNPSSKSWIFKYSFKSSRHEIGLGSFSIISISEARIKRDELRRQIYLGIDPIIEIRKLKQKKHISTKLNLNFMECAHQYIQYRSPTWKNPKHHAQWISTLKTYAFPFIGDKNISDVSTEDIVDVLQPIWHLKTETASRVRNRIELILNWATFRELRAGENPARWRGHLENLFPNKASIQKVTHMKAASYKSTPELYQKILDKTRYDNANLALCFLILTACRTNEVTNAKWSEVDFEDKVWIIPAARMKAHKAHRVPLSNTALIILKKLPRRQDSEYIFPASRSSEPISNFAMLTLLKSVEFQITVHGFRSTFRDWVAENTTFPGELAEISLAHSIKDKVEAAYRRGDSLEKRRELMETWSQFCSEKIENDVKKRAG